MERMTTIQLANESIKQLRANKIKLSSVDVDYIKEILAPTMADEDNGRAQNTDEELINQIKAAIEFEKAGL